jgi:hypothetical protein
VALTQGTNKPAHDHVLVDEVGFGADGVQLLTYWLCYPYQCTTKSVSYCPPTTPIEAPTGAARSGWVRGPRYLLLCA